MLSIHSSNGTPVPNRSGIEKHFWINVLLTILGFIPGSIHAIWVIRKY